MLDCILTLQHSRSTLPPLGVGRVVITGVTAESSEHGHHNTDSPLTQEAGSFGAPAGHYQFQVSVFPKHIVATIGVTRFQVFAFAFAIMQRMEQSVSIRYR